MQFAWMVHQSMLRAEEHVNDANPLSTQTSLSWQVQGEKTSFVSMYPKNLGVIPCYDWGVNVQ